MLDISNVITGLPPVDIFPLRFETADENAISAYPTCLQHATMRSV